MKKKLIVFLILVVFITGCGTEAPKKEDYKFITYEETKELMNTKSNVYLIDVRTMDEYNTKHIEGAINISSNELDKIASEDIKKDDYIIVYCLSGGRSKESYNKLKEMGYTNVYDFGSINNWVD